jgi:tetratricopeptide (TPR) repeat protein
MLPPFFSSFFLLFFFFSFFQSLFLLFFSILSTFFVSLFFSFPSHSSLPFLHLQSSKNKATSTPQPIEEKFTDRVEKGIAHFQAHNYSEAISCLEAFLAAGGSSERISVAAYYLGRCYWEGAKPDQEKAFSLFQRSAAHKKDFNESNYYLALCYFQGKVTEKDDKRAKELCDQCIEQNTLVSSVERLYDQLLGSVSFLFRLSRVSSISSERLHVDLSYLLLSATPHSAEEEKAKSKAQILILLLLRHPPLPPHLRRRLLLIPPPLLLLRCKTMTKMFPCSSLIFLALRARTG